MQLQNNKILITGATAGIGEALAVKFLQLNNYVIAVGRNNEKLKDLSQLHKKVIPYQCDLTNQKSINGLANFIRKEHKDLNILVNNAGIQHNYRFEENPPSMEKIEQEVRVNFLAPLKLITLLLPTLQKNPNAAIVNVSSGLAIVPKPQAPVYCGTKAGIHIFSKSLRFQLENVKVFEIIPPMVDTAMTRGRGQGKITPERLAEEFIKQFKKNNYEINIHKVKLLRILNRISPSLAKRIMEGITRES